MASESNTTKTVRFDIFMAGDMAQAKQLCREYCFSVGLCVTVEPVDYIYTGGEEAGFCVGIINYPRFPQTEEQLEAHARSLADLLMKRLCQNSYTIVGSNQSYYFSRYRKEAPFDHA